jgi:hypothetical protein
MFFHVWGRRISLFLLLIMAVTHGGWFTLINQGFAKTKTEIACGMSKHCCCDPGACTCEGHHHQKQLDGLSSADNCGPAKQIVEVGFDTSPSLLSNPSRFVLPMGFIELGLQRSISKEGAFSASIFRPPQIS